MVVVQESLCIIDSYIQLHHIPICYRTQSKKFLAAYLQFTVKVVQQ